MNVILTVKLGKHKTTDKYFLCISIKTSQNKISKIELRSSQKNVTQLEQEEFILEKQGYFNIKKSINEMY